MYPASAMWKSRRPVRPAARSFEERGAHLFCPNRDGCKPQMVMRLSHFASRDAMDIDTFSEKTAAPAGGCGAGAGGGSAVRAEEGAALRRWSALAKRRPKSLLAAIEKSKDCALAAFIYAVGIPNIGIKTARDLAERSRSIDGAAAGAARGARADGRRGRDRGRFHCGLL